MIEYKYDFKVGHQTVWEGLHGSFADACRKGDELATRMGSPVELLSFALNIPLTQWQSRGFFLGLRRFKHNLDFGRLWEMSEDYKTWYCCMDYATTPSLSQKLVGLGLAPDTADLRYDNDTCRNNWLQPGGPCKPRHIPVWSFNALIAQLERWTKFWRLEPYTRETKRRWKYSLFLDERGVPGMEDMLFSGYTPIEVFVSAISFLLREGFKREEDWQNE